MTVRRLRWWLAAVLGLLSLLLPACSKARAQSQAVPAARPARPAGADAEGPAKGGATAKPKHAPAAGPARRHPFVPVNDAAVRRASMDSRLGPLALKGICGSEQDRTAIIQEGQRVHFLRVNEHIGGLSVLAIRDGEVVLGAGRRKRILSLYGDGPDREAEGTR